VRLASLAASSILHGGLMWSSLRPRVMCGIRDSSHTHMHTQNTHTHTHTHTHSHTHTYTQIHTHPHPHPWPDLVCVWR
jgi:ABC-type nickel/cobalt efflux system permease component RcnA